MRRGGTVVAVGLPPEGLSAELPASDLAREEKVVTGSFYGSCSPQLDMPKVLDLYMDGLLPLDRLVTPRLSARRDQRGLRRHERRRGRAGGDPPLSRILIGEGFAGSGPNAAHVNTVLGSREGPVGTAWATALATPRAGHASFVVVARPNMPVKPPTLFVNKAEIREETHGHLHWGAAQAAVAQGVLDAVADGTIPQGEVDDLALIAAVWVDWAANEEERVFANNRRGDPGGARRPLRKAGRGSRSSWRSAPSRRTPSSAAREDRARSPRAPLDRARPSLSRGLGPGASTVVRGHARPRRDGRGPHRHRLGRHDGRLRALRAPLRRPGSRSPIERHVAVLETITFHAGRYWPLEAALWDLAGQGRGQAGRRAPRRPARPRSRPTPRPGSSLARPSAPSPRCACGRRASGR